MEKQAIQNSRIINGLLIAAVALPLLYFGKTLFIPLFYGLFIAIVLYPICRWLE